ncbi:MAG: ATP-binding protein [Syntrophobacterales bacterium]|jgi:two-component system sensor histidine kinase HydH
MTKAIGKYPWLYLFLWAILGGLAVLAPIVFFLANSSIRSDRENMTQLLVEKGAALIRSFEAGARTGMMGMGWGGLQIQRLLVETARQPDIIYLVVTDENGSVVAHSDPEQIGKMHENSTGVTSLERNEEVRYHQVQMENGVSAFEVYKRFTPIASGPGSGRMRHRGMMMRGPGFSRNWDKPSSERGLKEQEDWCSAYWKQAEDQPGLGPAHFIFVGLDMSALESARTEARRHTLAMSAGMLLLGLAAMVSLFLAQGFKLARRSLAKVRAFSGQVVENLPMGLIASDENGRVAAFNETAEAILKKSSQEALGESAAGILPPELWQLTARLGTKGAVVEEELECKIERSESLPLSVSAASIHGQDGAFLGHVFIFNDLTEARRLQQEVERSRRLASLGSLAAGVAHEIRNPLSSIKGFATYFRERFSNEPQDKDTATTMIQEVERLDRVIGQLLEFARPSTLKIKPSRVADLIQHSLKLIDGDARAKGVEVKAELPSDLPEILIDADRMNQVLLNLYLNSIQALAHGGTLEVKVSRNEPSKLTTITVADNGQGIDPADQDRVFDPYFTTKSDGTGLGLAIVHKIIEAHNGEIKITSNPDLGTTITLTLPDLEEEHGSG